MTQPREPVQRFANLMELVLQKNDHKGGQDEWRKCSIDYLLRRLREEVDELEQALRLRREDTGCEPCREERSFRVRREAADIANFAMMINDNPLVNP